MPPLTMTEEVIDPTLDDLMSSKLNLGWSRYDRNCLVCSTQLLEPPPPKDSGSMTRGIPFCVSCKSHVITDVNMLSQVQELEDKHGDNWVTGSILIDIASPTNSFDDGNKISLIPSQEGAELTVDEHTSLAVFDHVAETRDEIIEQEKTPTQKNLTLHDQLLVQEKEAEEYRLAKLREAKEKRLAAEEELRKERLEAMRKEEAGRKEAQMRRQMEEMREAENLKSQQTESRLKQLQANEIERIKSMEDLRQKQEDELVHRVISQSSTAVEDDYQERRDIATKVLGAKMMQGYILRESQCELCEMPLMEKDGNLECVVCPVLAKKAKKKNKQTAELEPSTSMKLTDSNPKKLSTVTSDTNNIMETFENAKHGIFDSHEAEAQAKLQEAKYMLLLDMAKNSALAEATVAKHAQDLTVTSEQDGVEKKPSSETPLLDFIRKTKKDTLTPEEEAEIRFADEERFLEIEEAKKKKEEIEAKYKTQKEEDEATYEKYTEKIARSEKQTEEEREKGMTNALDAAKESNANNFSKLETASEINNKKANSAIELAEATLNHLSVVQKGLFHEVVGRATDASIKEIDEMLAKENGVLPPNLHKETVEIEVIDPIPIVLAKISESARVYESLNSVSGETAGSKPEEFRITKEQWDERRANSRKTITSMMMEGWTMVTEYCHGKRCRYSPLLCNDGIKKCPVCEGTGTGEDGAYLFDFDDSIVPDEKSSDEANPKKTEAPVQVLATTEAVEAPKDEVTEIETDEVGKESPISEVIDEIENSDEVSPTPAPGSAEDVEVLSNELEETKNEDAASQTTSNSQKLSGKDFKEKRAFVSKEIGRRMLDGWQLLDDACPFCVMPLMSESTGGEPICVLCGPLEVKKKEEEQKKIEREKLEEQERLKMEMEEKKRLDEERIKKEEEQRIQRTKEEEEQRILDEQKQAEEEEVKKKVEAEIKKREEEIKEDLKQTEERVRSKNIDMYDEMQRSTEKKRLVSERKRFAEIVSEVKKIEEVRKKQEEEDSRSGESRRSRLSVLSRKSRESISKAKISNIEDGDDASVGGVSIQFPPDFDYDDEDAIRQVISLAKLRKKSGLKSSTEGGAGNQELPPMSISFVSSSSSQNSVKKRSPLLPPQSNNERRKPNALPASLMSRATVEVPSQSQSQPPQTPTKGSQEEFDDGVSHMSMVSPNLGSTRKSYDFPSPRRRNVKSTVQSAEEFLAERARPRRSSVLDRIQRSPSYSREGHTKSYSPKDHTNQPQGTTPRSERRSRQYTGAAGPRSQSLTRLSLRSDRAGANAEDDTNGSLSKRTVGPRRSVDDGVLGTLRNSPMTRTGTEESSTTPNSKRMTRERSESLKRLLEKTATRSSPSPSAQSSKAVTPRSKMVLSSLPSSPSSPRPTGTSFETSTPASPTDASVQSVSSRKSTLGDILSKIESAKAQLEKKAEEE